MNAHDFDPTPASELVDDEERTLVAQDGLEHDLEIDYGSAEQEGLPLPRSCWCGRPANYERGNEVIGYDRVCTRAHMTSAEGMWYMPIKEA